MEKPEPLNEKWTEFVEKESRDGIVVFSLGSVANTELMPMDIKVGSQSLCDIIYIWLRKHLSMHLQSSLNLRLSVESRAIYRYYLTMSKYSIGYRKRIYSVLLLQASEQYN
jgi:hypothetical protein